MSVHKVLPNFWTSWKPCVFRNLWIYLSLSLKNSCMNWPTDKSYAISLQCMASHRLLPELHVLINWCTYVYCLVGSFTLPYIASCMYWPTSVWISWEPYITTYCHTLPHIALDCLTLPYIAIHWPTGVWLMPWEVSPPLSHTLLPISHTAAGATQASSSSISAVSKNIFSGCPISNLVILFHELLRTVFAIALTHWEHLTHARQTSSLFTFYF